MIEQAFDEGFNVAWEVTCEAIVSPGAARAAGFQHLTSSQLGELVKSSAGAELSAADLAGIQRVAAGRPDSADLLAIVQTRLNDTSRGP